MQKTPDNRDSLQFRHGFSLVELLIVMAVLTAVAGLILPSMRGPLDKSRLTGAAKQLQASLAKARSLAIREGSEVTFRYEISGDRFVIERIPAQPNSMITVLEDSSSATTTPSGLSAEIPEAPVQPVDDAGMGNLTSLILREGRLPTGVSFADSASDSSPSTQGSIGTEAVSSESMTRESTSMTRESTTTGLRGWSDPIRFQPSGRTDDVTIRVAGQRDFVVDITLRGLTAMASYSAPKRLVPQQSTADALGTSEALP